MRILGLDLGTKTLGVAISDEMGRQRKGLKQLKLMKQAETSVSAACPKSSRNMERIKLYLVFQKI